MRKRKTFKKTDISIPLFVEITPRDCDELESLTNVPEVTAVFFGRNATAYRTFDFAKWYGVGIDTITYAFQVQIERLIAKQDSEVEGSTIATYCRGGIRDFLDYLVICGSISGGRIGLNDINRTMIDSFLGHLSRSGIVKGTQKSRYNNLKSILQLLGRRKLINIVTDGDSATFPTNPFPNANRDRDTETALTRDERKKFTAAIKEAVKPVWTQTQPLSSIQLAVALLIIALHTGRNTTPLLEMEYDCLLPHPKEGLSFLALWKRRGHNTSKVVLKQSAPIERLTESTPTIKRNVHKLIERVIAQTEALRAEAPIEINRRVWLHYAKAGPTAGQIVALTDNAIKFAVKAIVSEYKLIGADGEPLRINISRLRKTFSNRIFELTDGDLIATAAALGDTPKVTSNYYLAANDHAKRNWMFMGEIMVKELLTDAVNTIDKRTPAGNCSNPNNGEFAPKEEGSFCFSFLNCVRCRHYVITGDDLHKLFSFYYRVYAERKHMNKQKWARQLSHIPRLIDKYIIAEGIRRGVFKPELVEIARKKAVDDPHPFWSFNSINSLEILA